MFFNEKHTVPLRTLEIGPKVALSIFLVLCGIMYIFGFFNILLHYGMVDGKPGLSIRDIQITYYGSGEKTKMEKAIDSSMRTYFATDNDYDTTKEWLAHGADEHAWTSNVKPIFDTSCSTCHSTEAKVADVVTVEYEDVSRYLAMDSGKSIPRLVQATHTHLGAITPLIFILVFVLYRTSYNSKLKGVVAAVSFFAVFLDVGSWWLAKLSPSFAIIVIIGGMTLGLSFGSLTLLPLYDIWLKKIKNEE